MLTGVAPVADDFYRLSHHDSTGALLLVARNAGLGLAAALLAELVIADKIEISEDSVVMLSAGARTPPSDGLAHTVLDEIRQEPQHHNVATWLSVVGPSARSRVADRLIRGGHLTPTWSRRLFREAELRHVPASSTTAAGPWARLAIRLSRCQELTEQDVFLAGLAAATGLLGRILDGARRSAHLHQEQTLLDLRPALHELVCRTQMAVGKAVLSHRG